MTSSTRDQWLPPSKCKTCGGPISDRNFMRPSEHTGRWLHIRGEDWADNVHQAEPDGLYRQS